MNMKKLTYDCSRCSKRHEVEIDHDKLTKEQLQGDEPILDKLLCPNLAVMYRVTSVSFDLIANSLKEGCLLQEFTTEELKKELGEFNFASKLDRFKKLELVLLGIPDEYYDLLRPIVFSYYCGYFYPAMTGAGALGERILNRLIIKTRKYFKSSLHYKKVYSKKSFDQWDIPIEVLKDWAIISNDVGTAFSKLKQYRNDSIHYKEGYDFESNAYNAIKALTDIIDMQFNFISRKDLFWVFDVPGEIWLKNEVINNPFVKEFVIPSCTLLTPLDEPFSDPPVMAPAASIPLNLTDEEFIKLRNSRKT
jgi:hypothetical protein